MKSGLVRMGPLAHIAGSPRPPSQIEQPRRGVTLDAIDREVSFRVFGIIEDYEHLMGGKEAP